MSNLLSTILPYIPPPIVRAAEGGDSHLATSPQAAVSEAAVLFADVSGFTPLTEALARKGPEGPEELTRLLNGYFSRMIAILESEGGEVVKFSGDAVTVLFAAMNEPLSHVTRRAYQAALAMEGAMVEFAQLETSIGPVALGLKIGIGAGKVLSMQVGGILDRWEYVIAGDPLRQMAEAEQRAQRGDIILSPEADAIIHPATLPSRPLQRVATFPEPALKSFWRYLPGAVRWWLSEGLRDWLAELRPMSVLFVGVGGLDYERPDATDKQHTFLRAAQETLYRYEGTLNRLAVDDKGTVLLALLGAPPFAHEDDPLRAVRCALDLQQVAVQQELRLAIGVTSGRVFAGPLGGPTRREYTVMGDVVNLAARLMTKAGAGGTLCDFKTSRQARHQLAFESLPPMRLKGKAGLIPVYRPTGSAVQTPQTAKSAMIGRQRELTVLSTALDVIEARESRVLIIEGQAGIGKSRLVVELTRLVRERGLTSLLGAGQNIEQHSPYRAWRDIFSSYFELDGVTEQAQRQQRVSELLMEVVPEQIERLPLLNDLLNLELPDNELTAALSPEWRQNSLALLLVELLRAWPVDTPLILVLEDAHWLDSLSWDLALQVTRAFMVSSDPLLLVVVTRPLEPAAVGTAKLAQLQALASTETLSLTTLSQSQIMRLVSARLGIDKRSVPEPIAELVRKRAEGNPFFAEELVFTLRDQGLIRLDQNRCLVSDDLASYTLPDTLQGLILARIDRLSPAKQLTLKVAAVIGRTFAVSPLHDTLNEYITIVQEGLQKQLDDLTQRDFTQLETSEPDFSYIFKHVMTQEVAYQTLLFAQRKQLHRTVAMWYETAFTQQKGGRSTEQTPDFSPLAPYYPLLVHHYHHAEESEREGYYTRLAGERAAAQYANAEAIRYFSRALELTPPTALSQRYELLVAREKIVDLQGQRQAQQQDLTALSKLAEKLAEPQKQVFVALRKANYALVTSDHAMAITAAQRAINFAPHKNKSEAAAGYLLWGHALMRQGEYQAAQSQLEQALTFASPLSQTEADTYRILGVVFIDQGHYAQAIKHCEEALAIYQKLDNPRGISVVLNNLANIFHAQGDYAKAKEHWEKALQIHQKIGDRQSTGMVLNNLGTLYMDVGDYAKAQRYNETVLHLCREIDSGLGQCFALLNLGLLFHYQNEAEVAYNYSQQAFAMAQQIGSLRLQAYGLTNLGHTLAELARLEEASAAYQQVIALWEKLGQSSYTVDARAGLARIALAQEDWQAAQGEVEQILSDLAQNKNLDGIEEPFQVYLTCYHVLALTNHSRAQPILQIAHNLLQTRAAKIINEDMRRSFIQNVPSHREIMAEWMALK